MNILERIFGKDKGIPPVTHHGILGEIIEEAEADFLTHWLERIERGEKNNERLPEKLHKKILERDGHKCSDPHCKTPTYRVQVHHLRWREFSGSNDERNLVSVCLNTHQDLHPGLRDAFDKYRRGDKNAFKEYTENNKIWKQQPVTRVGDVLAGIVFERSKK